MANSEDLDQTEVGKKLDSDQMLRMANSVDPDETADNGKQCRPLSDCWQWQIE